MSHNINGTDTSNSNNSFDDLGWYSDALKSHAVHTRVMGSDTLGRTPNSWGQPGTQILGGLDVTHAATGGNVSPTLGADSSRTSSGGLSGFLSQASNAIAGVVQAVTSPFKIILTWDASVLALPAATMAAFEAAVQSAANILMASFSDAITLRFNVGWNEYTDANGASHAIPLGTALGGPSGGTYQTVAAVKSALTTHATTTTDTSAINSIGTQNPNGNAQDSIAVWSAQEKALGLGGLAANDTTAIDGVIGFSSDWLASGDPVGAALHELTHAMGRTSGYGPSSTPAEVYGILDLFRYSAAGVHNYAGGTAAYFSVDGGNTPIVNFSTTSDYGDFASDNLSVNDPFTAFAGANSNALTEADLAMMDAIGFTRVVAPGSGGGGGGGGGTGTTDLIVSKSSLTSTSVSQGSNLNLSFIVADIGTGSAALSTASVTIDSKLVVTNQIKPLVGGGSMAINDLISTAGLSLGVHTITINANAINPIAEANTANDSVSLSFTVTASTLPDLAVTSTSLSSTNPVQGNSIKLTYSVADISGAAAGATVARVLIDGKLYASNNIGALAAGGSSSISDTISTAGLTVGAHTITVVSDATNLVTESNEANNSATINFTVAAPPQSDLTISSAHTTAASVVHGSALGIAFTESNIGQVASGANWTGFYIDGKAAPVVQSLISAIGVNVSFNGTASISTAGLSIGTHTLTIGADIYNSVHESNETNNSLTISFKVT